MRGRFVDARFIRQRMDQKDARVARETAARQGISALPTLAEVEAERAGKPIPKGKPHILIKREMKSALVAKDNAERKKCHLRSGMRCEVKEVIPKPEESLIVTKRCKGKVVHNHHLKGGNGRRNVGDSILAEHRLDTCQKCHQDIEAELLVPANRDHQYDAAKVTYERRAA